MKIFLYICIICSYTFADDLIDKLKICKRSDPEFNGCLKDAIEEVLPIIEYGLPEFNIPSMQPMLIPKWIVKKDPSATLGFDQSYSDIRIYNLASSKVKDIQSTITDTDFFLRLKLYNSLIKFTSKYEFENAVFLGYDLTGSGYALFVDIGNYIDLNITGQITNNILQITSVDLHVDVNHMDINLNRNHLELSKESSEHLNKNSELLFEVLSRGYNEMIVDDIKIISNSIFSQLDFDKVFPK